MKLWRRILHWAGHAREDDELAEEIRLHREMLEQRFAVEEGMTPAQARKAAAIRFGNATSLAEESREQWNVAWIAAAFRDLTFAWRLTRRQPLLSAAAVLTVALGVGANTAIVSVIETLLVNPLGLRHADAVMVAHVNLEKINMHHAPDSGVEFREIQAMTDAFSTVGAMEPHSWTAQVGGSPVRLLGQAVTPDFFRTFRVTPALGRLFSAEDRNAVVLAHSFWQSQFGGDPQAIGRALVLDGAPYRIVGVAPADFPFPPDAQVWTPLVLEPRRLVERGMDMTLSVFARRRDGVSAEQAKGRVARYVQGLLAAPENRDAAGWGYGIELSPFAEYTGGDLRRPLWLLWAASSVLLLTGCANVAGLLLTRAAGRRREIAIRVSLGAAPLRIVRQLLIESLLLGVAGGACGLALAFAGVSAARRLALPGRQWLAVLEIDQRVLAFALVLALASGLLFGLAPAFELLRESHTGTLARSRRRRRFQDVFVAAEAAGAFALVAITCLLLRSLWAVERLDPGFDATHLTTAFLMKPQNDPGFLDRLAPALSAAAGAESAALAYPIPFSGGGLTSGFGIRNRQYHSGEPEWHGEAYMISPEYLRTLRIPLLRGRNLAASDNMAAPVVCLIDARLAERFFPGQDPIGQEISMYRGWGRIVGVVGAIRGTTLEEGSRPVAYYALAQMPFLDQIALVVRSGASAGATIRESVRRTNASVAVYDMRTMADRIGATLGVRRILALLVALFGAISLLLAAVGLYGVVAQVVAERTGEIGIRMAMGARPAQILVQFGVQGLRAGLIGVGCGLALAASARPWVGGLLYQVNFFDPVAFAWAGAGVLALLLAAVWWPARRGSRVEPRSALRYE